MIKYLTVADVLLLHYLAIEKSGGSHGIRDLGLIESAVARPRATFGREDLYKGLFDKVAVLCHSLIKNHAFIDGNKRTSLLSSMTMLELNGYKFNCSQNDLVSFGFAIDNENVKESEIAAWFKKRSKKL